MGIINYPYTQILTSMVCCHLDIADLIFPLWRMLLGIKMNQGPLQKNASWMFGGMNRSRRRTKIWTGSTYMEAHCSMLLVCQELPYKNLLTLKVQNPLIFLKPFWFRFVNQLVCSRVVLCKYTQLLMTKPEMEENYFSLHKIIGIINWDIRLVQRIHFVAKPFTKVIQLLTQAMDSQKWHGVW